MYMLSSAWIEAHFMFFPKLVHRVHAVWLRLYTVGTHLIPILFLCVAPFSFFFFFFLCELSWVLIYFQEKRTSECRLISFSPSWRCTVLWCMALKGRERAGLHGFSHHTRLGTRIHRHVERGLKRLIPALEWIWAGQKAFGFVCTNLFHAESTSENINSLTVLDFSWVRCLFIHLAARAMVAELGRPSHLYLLALKLRQRCRFLKLGE